MRICNATIMDLFNSYLVQNNKKINYNDYYNHAIFNIYRNTIINHSDSNSSEMDLLEILNIIKKKNFRDDNQFYITTDDFIKAGFMQDSNDVNEFIRFANIKTKAYKIINGQYYFRPECINNNILVIILHEINYYFKLYINTIHNKEMSTDINSLVKNLKI